MQGNTTAVSGVGDAADHDPGWCCCHCAIANKREWEEMEEASHMLLPSWCIDKIDEKRVEELGVDDMEEVKDL